EGLEEEEEGRGFRRRARWNANAGHDGILKPRRLCTTAGKEFCMFQRIVGKTHSPVQTAVWLALMMVFLAQGKPSSKRATLPFELDYESYPRSFGTYRTPFPP